MKCILIHLKKNCCLKQVFCLYSERTAIRMERWNLLLLGDILSLTRLSLLELNVLMMKMSKICWKL